MEFRKVSLNDVQMIIGFREDTQFVAYGSTEDFDAIAYEDRLTGRIEKLPEGQLLVLEDNQIIGQLGMVIKEEADATFGYISLLYLTNTARGQGYGAQILNRAEAFFKEKGLKEYRLKVSVKNTPAISLYKKHGMTVHTDLVTNYIMSKRLI